ncbi:MAG: tyrosine--tRNA ligase, partial [Holosporales bacterium]|nr:tyrosine--tRNA ligase [Holosporales bacterium]
PKALDKFFCSGEKLVFYVGFDPTAKSLHVGHLLWIKLVEKLQRAGHKPIIICGGATGKIGDPTWKSKQRVMINEKIISENTELILEKLGQLINFKIGGNPARLLNNYTWLSKLNYLDFLRDFGPLFSVNKMLAMDSVCNRLEMQQHLSFLEFNYMLLQAYDFLHLFEHYDCKIQIGGADQWANMISGIDLIRRKTGEQAVGLSLPLLTTSNGGKMGKTNEGTIWLNQNLTSPFNFWHYWRNVDDHDVVKFLKLFTILSPAEADETIGLISSDKINKWKILLADKITTFVHPGADLDEIKSMTLGIDLNLDTPMQLEDVLVLANLAESKTASKRLIDGGGVKIDGITATNYKQIIKCDTLISVGKKKLIRICKKQEPF